MTLIFPKGQIATWCEQYPIKRLSVFGSLLHGTFNPESSDIDLLVELLPGAKIGWKIVQMQDELEAIVQHRVDLRTPGSLSPRFRESVMKEAQTLYERAG